jgi:hypothetical protein
MNNSLGSLCLKGLVPSAVKGSGTHEQSFQTIAIASGTGQKIFEDFFEKRIFSYV